MENASQRDSVMNQTFTVDRGQLDDHKYIFFISNCSLYCSENTFLKKFQDNGNSNKCTVHGKNFF